MESTGILLSICIPTYNRAELLRTTLATITSQAAFSQENEIEIIVSDNASADHTTEVVAGFIAAFPDKIRYHRHPVAILPDLNFEAALKMAGGQFLKLHNDNLEVFDGSLAEILKVIRATAAERPIIFFTNGNQNQGNPIEVLTNMDQYVTRISFFSTWMGGFGIWREEFEAIDNFVRYPELKLIHTDVLFRLLAKGKRVIALFGVYFSSIPVQKKGGYNIAEVFGRNYLGLLREYVSAGMLSDAVFQQEKRLILTRHIIPYYFDHNNAFDKTGFFEYMQDYLHDDYFYEAVEHLISDVPKAAPVAAPAPAPAKSFEEQKADYWRALNPHNHTVLTVSAGPFDFSRVTVGRRSYGELNIMAYGRDAERLTIGSFVSIASEVKFMLGGNHPYEGFSTFPFKVKYFGDALESSTKGPIVVGDDVWIGYQTLIMSGVTIGQGAIVAAGSVVTRNVAPYTIVGGNPARYIKHRYPPAVVEKMLQFDFAKVSDEAILANRELLYEGLTADNVDAILARLQ